MNTITEQVPVEKDEPVDEPEGDDEDLSIRDEEDELPEEPEMEEVIRAE